MNKLTTAVVMCTYNGEKFIETQLDSILAQHVPVNKIFISDDNSSDNTFKILQNYKKKNPELFEIEKNQNNLGYIKNFEKTLLKAKDFDILFFSDQDDYWECNKTEEILKAFMENDVSLIFTNAIITDENLRSTGNNLWDKTFSYKIKKEFYKNPQKLLYRTGVITGATMALRSSLINDIVPFGNFWIHDAWIACVSQFFGKIKPLNLTLIKYRQSESQSVGLKNNGTPKSFFEWIKYLNSENAYRDKIKEINLKLSKTEEMLLFLKTKGIEYNELKTQLNFLNKRKNLNIHCFIFRLFFVIYNYLNKNYFISKYNKIVCIKDLFLHKKDI